MILNKIEANYLQEESLVFGGMHEEKDPRLGLKYFGPFHYSTESSSIEKTRLGILGNKSSNEKAKKIVDLISDQVESDDRNKWLFPPFPGMSKDTKFQCSIELSENWKETILEDEINRLLEISETNERIGAAVELYYNKIENILTYEDNPPDVVLCMIPRDIEEFCGISEKTKGAKIPKPTPLEKQIQAFKEQNQSFLSRWGVSVEEDKPKFKGYDFRNALKGKIMDLQSPVPIQLLRESTCDAILNYEKGKMGTRQDPASFAWNLSTALYYKANGKPWRLAKLRQDTCYVGISFYYDKLSFNKEIQTSMAQVFTHNGEGLVLRGTEVYIDEKTRESHLSQNQAEDLLKDVIHTYIKKAGRTPSRVVIHKSTLFSKAEEDGFKLAIEATNKNAKKDFVAISKRNNGIRFMRMGSYPVLRGTLISLSESEHILYTSGYTPRIRTYPGHSIPQPLLIHHKGDSEIEEICKEILGLTKLNWNTTAFATYLPITLAFSKRVGEVLSERPKGKPLQNHYRFYM
jgi:hypothetical protein